MNQILLVDDEPSLIAVLEPVLGAAGYRVCTAADGRTAVRLAGDIQPEVVLLDLGLPDIDGKQIIRELRATSNVPIIIISARHQEAEKIAALDLGADDYVDKPFEIGELMARIRAAMRRSLSLKAQPQQYHGGSLTIDYRARLVALDGDTIKLSPKEYDLLRTLALSAGQVVTHKRLLIAGWGSEATDGQYLRVYIGLLRQTIEQDPGDPQLLLTVSGVGYRLVGGPATYR
jgi:two-component system, OmpR family, KDP operon response regulator KdpE